MTPNRHCAECGDILIIEYRDKTKRYEIDEKNNISKFDDDPFWDDSYFDVVCIKDRTHNIGKDDNDDLMEWISMIEEKFMEEEKYNG